MTDEWWARLGDAALALVPAALTAFLAARGGGYFTGPVALVTAELLLVTAVTIVLTRRMALRPPFLIAALAMAGLAGWTLASGSWSDASARALIEADRVLLYTTALVLFGVAGYSRRRLTWMVYGLAATFTGVCALAVVSRTLPELILYVPSVQPDRLSYPLSYWNTLGLFAALGVVFSVHLASSVGDRWPVRVAASATIPVLAATLLWTYSRGGLAVCAGALAVYVVVGRPRGLPAAAIAVLPPTAIALLVAQSAELTGRDPLSTDIVSTGHRVAITLVACAGVAAVLRAVTLPLDVWARGTALPVRIRVPVLVTAWAVAAVAVVMTATALDAPSTARDKFDEFMSDDKTVARQSGSQRLATGSDNGRRKHWRISNRSYRADPWRGSGAGTYALQSAKLRPNFSTTQDAHSLYVEVRGELGKPGLALLVVALALILGAFAYRARGPDRPLFAALLAAGLAWAVAAGLDWHWEMPVVGVWLFAAGGAALAATPADRVGRVPSKVWLAIRVAAALACVAIAVVPARLALSQQQVDRSVDAFERGDCRQARSAALKASDWVDSRPLPYEIAGTCGLLERRPAAARRALRDAIARDPHNWQPHYLLALAYARRGQDPGAELRSARRLSPYQPELYTVRDFFGPGARRFWARRALVSPLPTPGATTP